MTFNLIFRHASPKMSMWFKYLPETSELGPVFEDEVLPLILVQSSVSLFDCIHEQKPVEKSQ